MNKLSGIYSALDSGNNKQALKLCNALLTKKKDENTNAVKILKAITLAKLGENEEAIKCADEVAFNGHTNETLLSNLNYFYKSVHQADKMTRVYEASFKVNPNNEHLAEGLFLAYAKVRDFDLQKHMALHLKKTFPTTQHSLWFLMTYLSMAQTDSPSKKLYIDVCQKAIEGLIAEGKITTSEQLFMYETVLDIQDKTQEHLELIQGKMGELYNVATERLKILGDLFQKLGRHQEAANSFSEILTKYEPDEWSCYMGYFDNIWALKDISKIDDAKQFVSNIQQQQEQQTKHSLRGPYLAEIEIAYRLLTQQDSPASIDGPVFDKLVDKMLNYFKRFGSKPVLYQDLKKYIHFIETKKSSEQRKEILSKVRELVVTDKDNTAYISQISNYYKLERALGLQSGMTLEQVKKTIDEIIQDYQYNTKKYPLAIESERYPGDDLILICYFLLLDQYQLDRKQTSLLIESAAILEYAASISTRNYQFNLYLLSLYFELGAHQLAHQHFKILNIKNIQWDTLGHLVMDQYVREPSSFTNTITSFEKSCKFYNENDSTPDYVAASYSNGCYSKILEIQKFQVKVANSFQKAVYETERQLFNFMLVRLKNLQSTPTITAASLIQMCKAQISSTDPLNFDCSTDVLSSFSFNQDKTIYDSFNPSTFKPISKEIQGITSLYLDCDNYDQSKLLLLLTYRRRILNILFSISSSSSNTTTTEIDQLLIDLESSLNQLKSSNLISNPIDLIVTKITFNQFKLLNLILNLLKINYDENKFNEIKELFELINNDINEIVKILNLSIKESEFVGSSLNNVSKSVRMVVSSFIEPFTWFSFVSLLINTALPGKRAKKKEEYHIQIRNNLESTIKLLSDQSIELINLINEKSLSKLSLTETNTSDNNDSSTSSSLINKSKIINRVNENSNQSFNELKQYLNSLKLLLNFSINNTNNVA